VLENKEVRDSLLECRLDAFALIIILRADVSDGFDTAHSRWRAPDFMSVARVTGARQYAGVRDHA